jgi:hypothetical protein
MHLISLRSLGVTAVVALAATAAAVRADLITFDDVPDPLLGEEITDGYHNLDWSTFHFLDTSTEFSNFGPQGYSNGTISPTNVAVNDFGHAATISSMTAGTYFDVISGYFTGGWNDNLSITVDGYKDSSEVYTTTFVVNSTGPSFETLNFTGIDTITFTSSGGTPHGYPSGGSGEEFALDNLTVNVPEPASVSLLALAGLGLLLCGRRSWSS